MSNRKKTSAPFQHIPQTHGYDARREEVLTMTKDRESYAVYTQWIGEYCRELTPFDLQIKEHPNEFPYRWDFYSDLEHLRRLGTIELGTECVIFDSEHVRKQLQNDVRRTLINVGLITENE